MERDQAEEARFAGATERGPRWQKWRHIEKLKVWEGVALSLNIEPDKVRSGYSWKAEAFIFEESQEFKDRLEIVCRKLGTSYPDEMVNVRELAAFATSFDWNAPPEFIEMAAEHSAQPTSEAAGEMEPTGAPPASASTYTTKLLRIVDAIRAEIGSDPQPNRWKRDAIEAKAHELLSGLSDRDAAAIATVLLPDEKRRK